MSAPSVLLRAGSWLYSQVPPAGQRARNPSFALEKRPSERFATRYTLLRDAGDWLLVEVAEDEHQTFAQHCQRPNGWFLGLAVRLYVARGDLVPVLTRTLAVAYDDGTSVDLGAGTALSAPLPESAPAGRTRRTAFGDGLPLPIEVPDDAVGYAYDAPPQRPAPPLPRRALRSDAELTFDRRALRGEDAPTWMGRDNQGRRGVYAERPVDGGVLVDLQGACGRYRARVDNGAIEDTTDAPGGMFDFPEASVSRVIQKGSALSWRDGSPAGAARADTPFEDEGTVDGGRRCFDVLIALPGARAVPESALGVCAAEADVLASPSHRSDEDVARVLPGTTHYVRIEVKGHTPFADAALLAAVRAVAKDELLTKHGDRVAIAPPGETAAEARRKVRAPVRRLLVRLEVTMKDGFTERRREIVDEGATPPSVVRGETLTTQGTANREAQLNNAALRAVFRQAFADVVADP